MKLSSKSTGEETISQFTTLTKQDLILESAIFNEKAINPKKCQQVLTKLIYLFDKGEQFNDDELSGLFFSITKLFQSEDPTLKHILFVALKYMKNTSVFCMVTNCINKDITSANENIRAIALRLLPLIVESQNPLQLERTLKNCLVNKNPLIVEGALHACCEIIHVMADVVRKCGEEIAQLLVNSSDHNIQFKSFLLVQNLKQSDRVSFVKTINSLIANKQQYGELCLVYVIRSTAELLYVSDSSSSSLDNKSKTVFLKFLEDNIQSDFKSVVLEASRALIALPGADNKQLRPVVERLREFLEESDEVYRYSVLRIFNQLVKNSLRLSLFKNFEQFRHLLSSGNKTIVSLAISILVKIANPEDLEKLLDQIFELLEDLPLFVKIEVIDNSLIAVRKNPKTTNSVIKFLTRSLKEKGNTEFRVLVVQTLNSIGEINEEFCTRVLEFMTEYIEDSQNKEITLAMLQSIGRMLLRISSPQNYFKFLINRLTLDTAAVVVATVSCLGQIALKRKSIQDDVLMILEPFRNASSCDETRAISEYYIDKINETKVEETDNSQLPAVEDLNFVINGNQLEDIISRLDNSLKTETFDTSFIDFSKLKDQNKKDKPFETQLTHFEEQAISAEQTPKSSSKHHKTDASTGLLNYKPVKSHTFLQTETYIKSRPEFDFLGDLLLVSEPVNLSDESAEIHVKSRKLIFKDYIGLEFVLQNNSENTLTKIQIEIEFECDSLTKNRTIGPDSLPSGEFQNHYVILKKGVEYLASAEFQTKLCYMASVFENGEEVNSYSDEFMLENLELKISDFVGRYSFDISIAEFKLLSDEIKGVKTQTQNYRLDFKTIDLAISELLKMFGMKACGNSEIVDVNKNYHTLYMIGRYLDRFPVLVFCDIGIDPSRKCVISMHSKASNESLANAFCDL